MCKSLSIYFKTIALIEKRKADNIENILSINEQRTSWVNISEKIYFQNWVIKH
jgi:hypothetical protein